MGKYYGALHLHYSSGGFISINITGALHLILKVELFAIIRGVGTVGNIAANYISEISKEQTTRMCICF
jgi:hypothetical protein